MMQRKLSMVELERVANSYGLRFKPCGDCHYQLLGGSRLVNFYDTTKGSKIYVAGDRKGRFVDSVAQVIKATGVVKQRQKPEPIPVIFGDLCAEIADVTISLSRNTVCLECDDREQAMRVFSLLEILAEDGGLNGILNKTWNALLDRQA